jgi:hypothetical protein
MMQIKRGESRMKAMFCIVALLCVLIVSAQEKTEKKSSPRVLSSPVSFYKAEAFMEMSEGDRGLYTMGLMDGFFASAFLGANEKKVASLNACTQDMTAKQLSAIITKYVKDHPELWHLPLSVEAINALVGACPGGLKS